MRARFTTADVIPTRQGRRAAYAAQPFSWLDQTTPRHGERPFALAHLDHTELDIELVSSVTGKPLGKLSDRCEHAAHPGLLRDL